MPDPRRIRVASAAVAALILFGCSGEPTTGDATDVATADASTADAHGHDHSGTDGLPPAGDGTSAYQIGYTLTDVRLPAKAGEPGRLSFVVENYRGRPHKQFLVEQDKRMHVYVVRDDLAVFRHVHPTLRPDGTWTGNLTLPDPGRYRVVTEFMARDEGGDGDFVMLGERVVVPGSWDPRRPPQADRTASSGAVEAMVVGDVVEGEGELRIRLTSASGDAPALGEYLGTSAHLTGFRVGDGSAVHMHPPGSPDETDDAVELTFHSRLPGPGRYALFLQVSVDGFLHTLPITVSTD